MRLDHGIQVATNFGQSKFHTDMDDVLYSIHADVEARQIIAATLPNELHIEIIRHVNTLSHADRTLRTSFQSKYDWDTLKACSAVCTTWYRIFRPFVFTTIRLQCREAAHQLSALSLAFPTYIRNLTLESRIDTKQPWIHVLFVSPPAARMTSVKEICWDPTARHAAKGEDMFTGCPPRIKATLPAILRGFVNTEVLKLRGHLFPNFLDVVRLVTALPQLRELYLTEVCWHLPETLDSPPRWLRRPESLRLVSIRHGPESDRVYVRGIELVVALWLLVIPPRRIASRQTLNSRCLELNVEDAHLLLAATQCLFELFTTKLTEAKAWHPYLELVPHDDLSDTCMSFCYPGSSGRMLTIVQKG